MSDIAEFILKHLDENYREILSIVQSKGPTQELSISHQATHLVLQHYLEQGVPNDWSRTGWERMMREIDSLKRLVRLHDQRGERWEGHPRATELVRYCIHDNLRSPCPTIRLLAEPFDYDPEFEMDWVYE